MSWTGKSGQQRFMGPDDTIHHVYVRQHRSKGFARPEAAERLEVRTTNRELFDAAVAAIRKEKRRRRASGGKAFEFQVTLLSN